MVGTLPPSLVTSYGGRSRFAHPTQLAMTDGVVAPHSRGMIYPSLALFIALERQGRRECRAPNAPERLACKMVERTHASHHRYAGWSGIPCAMVYGLYVLSSVCPAL